jgi:dTDP-4-amino-4,6-dideoxygalactose transaminase
MTATRLPVAVPMNDLHLQYEQIKPEIDAALAETIRTTAFILGPQVSAFETAFAEYNDVRHCVGVSNGTDALKLALLACDIGRGDEVITTSHTFGATVEAICDVGARPVFVDIEEQYFTIDPGQVAAAIGPRTKAIIPVHIYGHAADMEPITKIARDHELVVIEDAAQAQGARYRERLVGSVGRLGCFSFYPGKNLGAYGDAGGIITDDDDLATRLRRLRNHGQSRQRKFWYDELGYNHRMDGFQGAVLGVKLPHLDEWNRSRRRIAERYRQGLQSVEQIRLPGEADYAYHVYHLFVIRVPDRQALAANLADAQIETAVQYPHPVHLTDAFSAYSAAGDLPLTESACSEIISLPIFPELLDDQVDYVIEAILRHYS